MSLTTLPPQLWCGTESPTRERFRPIDRWEPGRQASGLMKPAGGLWTSTYATADDSGWLGWCRNEQWNLENVQRGWILTPTPARIITLKNSRECRGFLAEYGIPAFPDIPQAAFNYLCPDWLRVAADCDALRVYGDTVHALSVMDSQLMAFYGWDCESTLWMRWCFAGEPQMVDLEWSPSEGEP